MTTKLIFIRHGITDWNHQKRYQGHTDIPLNEKGREQAQQTAHRLEKFTFDLMYSSDLSRAYETATIVRGSRELEIIKEPGLRETNYGVWEGLTMVEIKAQYPELLEKSTTDPINTVYTHGESRGMMLLRVTKTVHDIYHRHPGKTIVITSHEGAIAAAVCSLLDLDFLENRAEYRLYNTAYHILDLQPEGTWKVVHKGQSSIQASDLT